MLVKRTELVDKHQIKVNEQAPQAIRQGVMSFSGWGKPVGPSNSGRLACCRISRCVRGERAADGARPCSSTRLPICGRWILDQPMTESAFRILQLTENLFRERPDRRGENPGHRAELKRLNPAWTNKEVAEHPEDRRLEG